MISKKKLDDRINYQLDLIAWCQGEAKKTSGSGELLSALIRDLHILCELARDYQKVFVPENEQAGVENTGANPN